MTEIASLSLEYRVTVVTAGPREIRCAIALGGDFSPAQGLLGRTS